MKMIKKLLMTTVLVLVSMAGMARENTSLDTSIINAKLEQQMNEQLMAELASTDLFASVNRSMEENRQSADSLEINKASVSE